MSAKAPPICNCTSPTACCRAHYICSMCWYLLVVIGLVLASTRLVQADGRATLTKDILPGANGSEPSLLGNINGTLLFSADDGIHGVELWRSDGTAEGTTLVKDIRPGPADSFQNRSSLNIEEMLFFVADDGVHGFELWRSDGTSEGTMLVKDIRSETADSYPSELININGVLFFVANDGVHAEAIWRSDGTAQGTTLVKAVYPVQGGGGESTFLNVNGAVFFQAYRQSSSGICLQLWRSDGTTAGTTHVTEQCVGRSTIFGVIPSELVNINGVVFFQTLGYNYNLGLWRTDGTAAGTSHVSDLEADQLTAVDGMLMFVVANHETSSDEVWRSDGTPAGTIRIKDSEPENVSLYELINLNGTLFFILANADGRLELWRSDGTRAGTTIVKDFSFGDGARTGTTVGKDFSPSDGYVVPRFLRVVHNTLFFHVDDYVSRSALWRSDGTTAGTTLVREFNGDGDIYGFSNITPINGGFIFTAYDTLSGVELWISDGTAAGTRLLQDIAPGAASSRPYLYTFGGPTLYFTAENETTGRELWVLPTSAFQPYTNYLPSIQH